MEFEVRRLTADEVPAAMELAMDTFLRFEAPDYGPEGVESFRKDIIENEAFLESCRSGENRLWGAFDGETLAGIFGMRGSSHICLVFTRHDYHRMGVATAIFRKLLADLRQKDPQLRQITLNSSPYGKPFYHHVGFRDADVEKTINGIRFTAMVYDL